jgi:predicted Zn-dependent peptidase
MSDDLPEMQEMHEHAAHGAHDPSLAPVAFTMAVLAVVLAATALLGHRAHTEELLFQSRATDQWAYYQAKNIRAHTYELFLDLLSVSTVKDAGQAEKVKEKYSKEVERYKEELKEIQTEASSLEAEVRMESRRANRFDLGEVFLEAAMVIASLTLLTKRRMFWQLGILMGVTGLAVTLSGFLVH